MGSELASSKIAFSTVLGDALILTLRVTRGDSDAQLAKVVPKTNGWFRFEPVLVSLSCQWFLEMIS